MIDKPLYHFCVSNTENVKMQIIFYLLFVAEITKQFKNTANGNFAEYKLATEKNHHLLINHGASSYLWELLNGMLC